MPRKSILTVSEKESLTDIPKFEEELIRYYTLSQTDLSIIRQHRGAANRLGFAVQLCYLRYPGVLLGPKETPNTTLIEIVSQQLKISADLWEQFGLREQTRREYLLELQNIFGYELFTMRHYEDYVQRLSAIALQTDKGIVLAAHLLEHLRSKLIILPAINVIERICAEALTTATRKIYAALCDSLSEQQCKQLGALLQRKPEGKLTWLAWLRLSPSKQNSKHMLEHIERLAMLQEINLPLGIERSVHQNRMLKMAREGSQMTPADLARLETSRKYATLVTIVIDLTATITDEIIDLHDKIIGTLFNNAKNKHQHQFQSSGKAINDKVRLYSKIGQALLEAKQNGSDPYAAIEKIIPWEEFTSSIDEANKLAMNEDFDFLPHISENYPTLRRYIPQFLNILHLRAAPSAVDLIDAIEIIQKLYVDNSRKLPEKVPTAFIKRRWGKLVFTNEGVHRIYYEICVLCELKNALRSGDIWVQGSRQYKDFDEYLIPTETFERSIKEGNHTLKYDINCESYLEDRLSTLNARLCAVNEMAQKNTLPDAIIGQSGLKITPLETIVPERAQALINLTSAMLPHVKITELLLEVEEWTGFSNHFTHLKTAEKPKDKLMLLCAILADAINLGLVKMAESSHGNTYAKLAWLQAWHIRDETYSKALSELVNAQLKQPFAAHWGDGKTSSSDGQRFRAGNKAQSTGHINPKYGSEPGRLFYTHLSDQYSPFSSKLVNVGIRDSTYVLDGLLYDESDLQIEEHYTDTAGFTDHVFAMMHLLGFRFAPRIRDLADTKIYILDSNNDYDGLKPMIGGTIGIKTIKTHWNEILRLSASIKQGTVTASLMLRKLASYPRQNGLALALRELGRIERSLFILDWLQNVELRRRVNAGLNKGEARNALARAVFFNRLGEIRDRNYEQQRFRASGLTLVTAAIVLWNTVYLERAIVSLRTRDNAVVDDELLKHLSPLGWEHINLTGDYVWKKSSKLKEGKFRPLRSIRFS